MAYIAKGKGFVDVHPSWSSIPLENMFYAVTGISGKCFDLSLLRSVYRVSRGCY